MKALNVTNFGTTRAWWAVLLVGILMVIGGFAYWFWPEAGYAVASQIFGWHLILAGCVQLSVSFKTRPLSGYSLQNPFSVPLYEKQTAHMHCLSLIQQTLRETCCPLFLHFAPVFILVGHDRRHGL